MNGIDVVLAALLVTAVLLGLVGGMVRIAFGVVSLAIGGVAAAAFATSAARHLGHFISSPELALLLGFVGVYSLVLLVFSLVGLLLRRVLSKMGLGWADRLFGALFALGLVVAATSLVSFALLRLAPATPVVAGSWAVPRLGALTAAAAARLPGHVREEVRRVFGIFEERVLRSASRRRREPPSDAEPARQMSRSKREGTEARRRRHVSQTPPRALPDPPVETPSRKVSATASSPQASPATKRER